MWHYSENYQAKNKGLPLVVTHMKAHESQWNINQ